MVLKVYSFFTFQNIFDEYSKKNNYFAMNKEEIKKAIKSARIEWQRHAFERMLERNISTDAVKSVLLSGVIIENYPDSKPYPSALFFGLIKRKPFYVIAAAVEQKKMEKLHLLLN